MFFSPIHYRTKEHVIWLLCCAMVSSLAHHARHMTMGQTPAMSSMGMLRMRTTNNVGYMDTIT